MSSGTAKRLVTGVRDYTEGLRPKDIKRLFDRDAADAFSVLVRDHQSEREPRAGLPRLLYRIRILFLGFSYRLTPARRLLFVACLLLAVLGVFDWGFTFNLRGRLVFEASPLWFVFSVAGLVLLLGLELVDQVKVRDELQIARQLQRELLPKESPLIKNYRICHAYRTANEVGGDYYDFEMLPNGRLALMVGDASGHGMAAGLLMAIANATLKLALDTDPAPPKVLELLNRALVRTGDQRAFMSLFYALLDPETGELEYGTAGHPFPLLRSPDGSVTELGEGGFPLGLRKQANASFGHARIEPGAVLVLYSDGLPEATNSKEQSFGYERLMELVKDSPTPESARDSILATFDHHLGGQPLEDDFSLVVLGREIPLPPLPGAPGSSAT